MLNHVDTEAPWVNITLKKIELLRDPLHSCWRPRFVACDQHRRSQWVSPAGSKPRGGKWTLHTLKASQTPQIGRKWSHEFAELLCERSGAGGIYATSHASLQAPEVSLAIAAPVCGSSSTPQKSFSDRFQLGNCYKCRLSTPQVC